MSTNISNAITQITTNRNTIREKLVELGIATSTSLLSDCATAIAAIDNQGAATASIKEGETYKIPKGYHNGSGVITGIPGGGNYSRQSKTVTPTKAAQKITPDTNYYALLDVTVNAIPDSYQVVSAVTATAVAVLKGSKFVNVAGEVVEGTIVNQGADGGKKTLDGMAATSVTFPAGYYPSGGTITLSTTIEEALAAI